MRKAQLEKWRAAIAALPSAWQKWDGEDTLYIAGPCFFCHHWEADGYGGADCTHPLDAVRDGYGWSDGPHDNMKCCGFKPDRLSKLESLSTRWINLLAEWAQAEVEREEWEREEASAPPAHFHISPDAQPETIVALHEAARLAAKMMEGHQP